MLVPVQEPQRLPTVEAGGGPARALPHGGAYPARKLLAFLGTITGAWIQGGRADREEEEGGYST